ncbi:hypothetical protein C8R43DRAFT_524621 [Mycena crocata]|nr:hypothetical protein C8R43DRAFT_524621 [Mycena crocata]
MPAGFGRSTGFLPLRFDMGNFASTSSSARPSTNSLASRNARTAPPVRDDESCSVFSGKADVFSSSKYDSFRKIYVVSRPFNSSYTGGGPKEGPPPKFSHWAVRIGNLVHELTTTVVLGGKKITYNQCEYTESGWSTQCCVGETIMFDEEIAAVGQSIILQMPADYSVFKNNCQHWVQELLQRIRYESTDRGLREDLYTGDASAVLVPTQRIL